MVYTLERRLESPPEGDEPLMTELTTPCGGADSGRRAMLAVKLRARDWFRADWSFSARRASILPASC